ncbi:hypothetical protein PINS_up001317 [Pythium insidiosum]|nr:hypothetical protein PINS_up001317 [Pythium insidiosum]
MRNLSFSDDDLDDDVVMMEEHQTFKTTKLQHLDDERADESLNASITSERLPRMSRTPYMKARGPHRSTEAPSMLSENTTNWTPSLSSPPQTSLLTAEEQKRQRVRTPPSAISSIAPASPVSKNLMKMGAFEYTPPGRESSSPRGTNIVDDRSIRSSPKTPTMPVFATIQAPDETIDEERAATTPNVHSQRKRSRSSIAEEQFATQTPTRGSQGRVDKPSPSLATPSSHASLRRKYSTNEFTTPLRSRRPDPHPKTIESIKQASEQLLHNESPMTPSFEMPSPLLRTQLKAMTPHTPLSNRLVGANLDIGSTSQEAKIQDYDESFNAGEPAPEFQLSLFPSAFQRGVGAVQISTLYSKFQGLSSAEKPALNVSQLAEALPDYGKERIEILLDTLVSRRLLRPFVVEGVMFWQIHV